MPVLEQSDQYGRTGYGYDIMCGRDAARGELRMFTGYESRLITCGSSPLPRFRTPAGPGPLEPRNVRISNVGLLNVYQSRGYDILETRDQPPFEKGRSRGTVMNKRVL